MLQDQIIVITGASSGIGAEMAVLLSEQGATPVLLARSTAKMNEVAKRIKGSCAIYELDVTSADEVNLIMEQILQRFGRIDVLINNAGFGVFETIEDTTLHHFEEMMDVNYMGMVRCIKAVLPSMLDRKKGHIINIASIAGKIGVAKSTGYAASKHAVLGFTNSLRQELLSQQQPIYVSAINPGPIDTPFFDRADPSGKYLERLPRWFILESQQAAQAVLNVIQHKQAEKNIPWIGGIGAKFLQMVPRSWDRWLYKFTNKK
jgi:short-subunit dehydrogenase